MGPAVHLLPIRPTRGQASPTRAAGGSPACAPDELDRTGDAQREPEPEEHARQRLVLERGAAEVADQRGVGRPRVAAMPSKRLKDDSGW